MEMDTDSAYMALSAPLHLIIRPHLRREYYETFGEWFPRPYCPTHRDAFVRTKLAEYEGGASWSPGVCCQDVLRHDTRTPGLFKMEYEGTGMVALNSKTYCCWNDNDDENTVKYSSKGLSKRTNNFGKQTFLDVIRQGQSVSGVNKGFVLKDNVMCTYSQVRTGLTYMYAKRRVLPDGVSTENIDI
jgi:hypothetical protein